MFKNSIDKDDMNILNSNYFYNSNMINIKLLNGDVFSIELNYFDDDENKIINKICNYDDKYRLRKHRLKIIKDNQDNNDEEKSIKEIFNNLEDNDTLYVYSEPPHATKEYYTNKYSYKDDNGLDIMFNYFYIKEKEDYYDTIDRLFFEIYDKNLPSLFFIDRDFYQLGYVQMYIDTLIKTIFEKEDITRIFFNSNSIGEMITFFIDCIIKYYRDLDTIGLDLNYNISNNKPLFSSLDSVLDKLFNKINTKNIYLNTYILKAVSNRFYINLLNNENIYIFTAINTRTELQYILKKFKSFNHNIFVKHNGDLHFNEDIYGWINVGEISNYYTYRHISTLDNYQLFNNYDLYEDNEDITFI